jgi:uncharacterized membrane protein YcaP (DUF421 family)
MDRNFKVKLNDSQSIQVLLQEIYDQSRFMITEVQTAINSLETSTKLADETMDGKTKYAKSMHDFHSDKEKAIRLKLDVAKIMNEILKYNGDANEALQNLELQKNNNIDITQLRNLAKEELKKMDTSIEVETYVLKEKK